MTWLCRVCHNQAKWVFEFGVSQINKKGFYNIHKCAYCELHLPKVERNNIKTQHNAKGGEK